jgi:Tol biopolymer transport system component
LNTTSGNKELRIIDFSAGTDDVLDTGLAAMTRPRWSADGSEIVVAGGEEANDTSALFRVDAASGDSTPLTAPIMGDAGHDVAADGRVYFVRKSGTQAFDIFYVSITADPSTNPIRVTTGSRIIGGVAVHPDATRLLFSRSNASSTDLVEYTIAGGDQRVIGSSGDEQADYTAGGDGIVVSRDSFDADSEIAVADADGVLITRCTEDDVINQSPAISAAESGDVDISPFVP